MGDHAPPEKQAAYHERFIVLKSNFEEASGLLSEGVHPWLRVKSSPKATGATTGAGPADRENYNPPAWEHNYAGNYEPPKEKPEFDLVTRTKGHFVLWGGLLLFLTFLREFLVWSAGSTYAWNAPKNLNPFSIRRYRDGWVEEKKTSIKQLGRSLSRALSRTFSKKATTDRTRSSVQNAQDVGQENRTRSSVQKAQDVGQGKPKPKREKESDSSYKKKESDSSFKKKESDSFYKKRLKKKSSSAEETK